MAAYRKWLGLDPWPQEVAVPTRRKRQHKATATDLDMNGPVELVVLSVKENAARCRLLGEDEPIEAWAKPIIACGSRQVFEMEQILPARNADDLGFDPICESNDLKEAGESAAALNPSDNQGVRFLIDEVRAKMAWEDREER